MAGEGPGAREAAALTVREEARPVGEAASVARGVAGDRGRRGSSGEKEGCWAVLWGLGITRRAEWRRAMLPEENSCHEFIFQMFDHRQL